MYVQYLPYLTILCTKDNQVLLFTKLKLYNQK